MLAIRELHLEIGSLFSHPYKKLIVISARGSLKERIRFHLQRGVTILLLG